MFTSLHTHTFHTGTKTISGYGKVTRGVEKLWEGEGKREGKREREDGAKVSDTSFSFTTH